MAKIGLDIGHGANTFPPSKGVYKGGKGYAEHDFNAKLGIVVKDLLKKNGHQVIMGQQPFKSDVPLRTRTNLYNREKVDLVVSLHANWNNDANVNGRCVFYWGTSSKSKALAVAIRDEIKKLGYSTHGDGLHAGKRGSWTNLHINRETNMPAVLVEHGFMSGNKDFDLIFGGKQDKYIQDMAKANVRGIQVWLGESYKDSKPVKPQTTKPKPSKPSSSGGGSVVNYMESKKMDSSFKNRKKLAQQYGIKNYRGTASQNIELLNKLKSGSKPKPTPSKPKGNVSYSGGSIVDYLRLSGNKHLGGPSFGNRQKLARKHGISNYRGTASQNTRLLNALRGGSSKPKRSVKEMADIIERSNITGNSNRAKHLGLTLKEYEPVRRELNRRYR